jgi:hypothetical protein
METDKWIWQPFDKLDKYQLDTPTRVYRKYDRKEEDICSIYSIDTYYDDNTDDYCRKNSKLFVSDEDKLIKAILSTSSFIYEGYEFIGEPIEDVLYFLLNHFDYLAKPIHKIENIYCMYLTPVFEIRIEEISGKVATVMLTSWRK